MAATDSRRGQIRRMTRMRGAFGAVRWPCLLVLLLSAMLSPSAHAVRVTVCFGAQESLVTLAPTGLADVDRQPLELAAKRTTQCFGVPRTVKDDGLVLKAVGQDKTYRPLPDAATVNALQTAGLLPRPLPSSALSTHETILGHFLWISLGALIVVSFLWGLRVGFQARAEDIAAGAPVITRPLRAAAFIAVLIPCMVLMLFGTLYAISWLRAWVVA